MSLCSILLRRSGYSVNGGRYVRIRIKNFSLSATQPYGQTTGGSDETNHQRSNVESDDEHERTVKANILRASLKYVNELGWSRQAITAGAEDIGYPGIVHGMFPNPGAELVHHFQATCNAQLMEVLENEAHSVSTIHQSKKTTTAPSSSPSSLKKQIQNVLECRLKMIIPYKANWPQALALTSLPSTFPNSLANLFGLIDDVCYYMGDRSVDFNWYTRRAAIAAIYKSTELYMLQDDSEDHRRTWEFLGRRIEESLKIYEISSARGLPIGTASDTLVNAASAFFHTASNMLGIHTRHS